MSFGEQTKSVESFQLELFLYSILKCIEPTNVLSVDHDFELIPTEMKTKDPNVFGYRFPKNKNSNIETSDKKIMIKTFLFY